MFGHRMRRTEVAEVFDPYLSFRLRITTTARWLPLEQGKKLCRFRALDVCAQFAQFFIEMLVAAVDVIDAADFCNSIGFRSEERRVGKECRSRWWSCYEEGHY